MKLNVSEGKNKKLWLFCSTYICDTESQLQNTRINQIDLRFSFFVVVVVSLIHVEINEFDQRPYQEKMFRAERDTIKTGCLREINPSFLFFYKLLSCPSREFCCRHHQSSRDDVDFHALFFSF